MDSEKKSLGIREAVFALLALVLLLGTIVGKSISYHDESRVAGIAKEMSVQENWAVPRLGGEPFLEYPPLGYIPQALLFHVFGASAFLALLPTLLFEWAAAVLVFFIAKSISGTRSGLLASMVLLTTVGFLGEMNRCVVDPTLVFFVTLALWGFHMSLLRESRRHVYLSIFAAAISSSFLVKGFLGPVLGALAAFTHWWILGREKGMRHFLSPWAAAFLLLPILGWIFLLLQEGGVHALPEIFADNLHRALSSETQHSEPLFYYLPVFLYCGLPWSLLLPLQVRSLYQSWKAASWRTKMFVSLCQLLVFFALFSAAKAKRPLYLLPLYPLFSVATGIWLDDLLRRPARGRIEGWIQDFVGSRTKVAGFLFFFIASWAAAEGFVLTPRRNQESLEPLFSYLREINKRAPVVLVDPRESVIGGAYFYMDTIFPRLAVPERETELSAYVRQELPLVEQSGNIFLVGEEAKMTEFFELVPVRDAIPVNRIDFGRRRMDVWKIGFQ